MGIKLYNNFACDHFKIKGNEFLNNGISRIRYFVIDEADRMIEKGHFNEMDKILGFVNK